MTLKVFRDYLKRDIEENENRRVNNPDYEDGIMYINVSMMVHIVSL
ncbi:hypothetical protein AGMMS49921_01150 [Endomicrobiia bacterium]|nr:hypothetical protein AGMMS49921_01150 [Endomicrobiia bacterium]